ncbi:MAG: isopentenyl phosphate kinase [Candidatus Diapherotrites archaeon]|nr:isopentenyl phosphate kinase [Candidatus Diapherotrites archaeon]
MPVPLYIMKVGGSVCTKKAENKFEANRELIAKVASEIKRAQANKEFQLILVHGAGPFGHTNVKNYGINDGIKTEQHVEGFIKTHLAMQELNSVFLQEFENAGLKAIAIDPTACIVQNNKKISKFETLPLELLLKMNSKIISIMYGDMVVDLKIGGSVVSGDAIISYLAHRLKASKILLGTDVAGVFEADPKKFPNAKRIEIIDKKNFNQIIKNVTGSNAIDVTGGMKEKLLKLRQQLSGCNALIFDMRIAENTIKALVGSVEGTKILL